MKNERNWTKTVGFLALGVMILSPAASYAIDLDLPQREERVEDKTREHKDNGLSNRYIEQEELRVQERKTREKTEKENREERQRSKKREHKDGDSIHGRENSGSGAYGGGGGGRGRGR